MTDFSTPFSVAGIPVLGGGGGIPAMFGKAIFVDYTNGNDGDLGESKDVPVQTLGRAYELAASGQNDLILINGVAPVQEDTMITWSKDKIHVIGMGAFGATDQEPRIIFSTAGIAAEVPAVLKVTGNKNTFTNIRVNNWTTFADARASLWDAGEGTVYTNCQFNMFGRLADTGVADVEARGDSTTWRNVKFGSDTLLQTVARPTLRIKGTGSGARMKNNYFEDCYFVCMNTQTSKFFVTVEDTNSLAFSNVMRNPVFLAAVVGSLSAVAPAIAVESFAGLLEGSMLFVNPASNCASFCETSNQFYVAGAGVATQAAFIGIGVTPS